MEIELAGLGKIYGARGVWPHVDVVVTSAA